MQYTALGILNQFSSTSFSPTDPIIMCRASFVLRFDLQVLFLNHFHFAKKENRNRKHNQQDP